MDLSSNMCYYVFNKLNCYNYLNNFYKYTDTFIYTMNFSNATALQKRKITVC
jgi:hypothetical protein